MKAYFLIPAVWVCLLIVACDSTDDNVPGSEPPMAPGLAYTESNSNFTETRSDLENTSVFGQRRAVSHSTNARRAGFTLDSLFLLIVKDDKAEAQLLNQNQLVGLDLPSKILISRNRVEKTFISYNNSAYYAVRYGLQFDGPLDALESKIKNAVEEVSGTIITVPNVAGIEQGSGIVTVESELDFQTVVGNAQEAIGKNENLNLLFSIDLKADALSQEVEIRPTTLLIFGNPNLGTPLMQESPGIGIDLPQKFLIWEAEDGTVNISYNDPKFIAERHGINPASETITTIGTALDTLATMAAGQ